jgi:hypothetical protein
MCLSSFGDCYWGSYPEILLDAQQHTGMNAMGHSRNDVYGGVAMPSSNLIKSTANGIAWSTLWGWQEIFVGTSFWNLGRSIYAANRASSLAERLAGSRQGIGFPIAVGAVSAVSGTTFMARLYYPC